MTVKQVSTKIHKYIGDTIDTEPISVMEPTGQYSIIRRWYNG